MPPPTPPPLSVYCEVGDVVLWYPGADPTQTPKAAVVTDPGFGAGVVTVNEFDPNLHDMPIHDACRHMDRKPGQYEGADGGGWRHKPETVLVRKYALDEGYARWSDDCTRLVWSPAHAETLERLTDPKPAAPAA